MKENKEQLQRMHNQYLAQEKEKLRQLEKSRDKLKVEIVNTYDSGVANHWQWGLDKKYECLRAQHKVICNIIEAQKKHIENMISIEY